MFSAILFTASVSSIGQIPIIFPCEPEKVLTYQAQGRWEEGAGPSTIIAKKVTWTTTFLQCSYSPTKAVAIVRGLPGDLAWYEPGEQPGTYAIFQTTDGLFIEQIKYKPNMDLQTIEIPTADQYLRFPLEIKTCASNPDHRADGAYCWLLDSIKQGADKPAWTIVYHTLPDFTSMTIEPGVGITAYSYQHFGTVEEVKVQLIRSAK